MSAEVEINLAEAGDARVLGEIMVKAMASHMIDKFMIPEEDPLAAFEAKTNWFIGNYSVSLADPTRRVFKASLLSTGEIVGLGAIHYHDGNFASPPEAEKADEKPGTEASGATTINDSGASEGSALPAPKVYTPPGFAQFYFGQINEIHKKHMQGVKHVVWTTLHVAPQFQGKGIGGAMLRWGFEQFSLDKEKVWIGTQMRGRNIYRRFGFEDVDHLDVDLSEWGGKLRGFGMHRSPLMLRQPGEFKKVDGIIDE